MNLRSLNTRISEHQQPSKGDAIFFHKAHCEAYNKKLAKIKQDNSYQHLKPVQKTTLVYEHFRSHLKIIRIENPIIENHIFSIEILLNLKIGLKEFKLRRTL